MLASLGLLAITSLVVGNDDVASGPSAELVLSAKDAFSRYEVVIRRGEYRSLAQGQLLGAYFVLDGGTWRRMRWGGCGTGVREVTVGPGRYPAGAVFPLSRERFGPGTYRFEIDLRGQSRFAHLVRRFRVDGITDAQLTTLLDALVDNARRGCAFADDVADAIIAKATPVQLERVRGAAADIVALHARVELLRRVKEASGRDAVLALLDDTRPGVALAAAVALADFGENDGHVLRELERAVDARAGGLLPLIALDMIDDDRRFDDLYLEQLASPSIEARRAHTLAVALRWSAAENDGVRERLVVLLRRRLAVEPDREAREALDDALATTLAREPRDLRRWVDGDDEAPRKFCQLPDDARALLAALGDGVTIVDEGVDSTSFVDEDR